MIGELPHHRLNKLGKIYGLVFYLQLGKLPIITITAPYAAEEVLKTQELAFSDHPLHPVAQMMGYENSSIFFAPYRELWRRARKIWVLELLGVKTVRSFKSIRQDEVSNLIGYIESSSDLPCDLSKRISACMNRIVSKACFGQTCKQQDGFISSLHEVLMVAGRFGLAEVFPSLRILIYLSGAKLKIDKLNRNFDEILNTILADHKMQREHLGGQAGMPDKENLVDVVLRLRESNEMGFHLSTDSIKGIIFNPKVMAKAQDEIQRVLKGKDRIQESVIEELNYLKCIIKETLRMHPPTPLIPRAPRQGSKINRYDIPMNATVLTHAYAIGRDPRYWTDPEKFEPETFMESSVDYKGTHYQLLPFGSGRRICPGMAFATTSVEFILASLLYGFGWKLPNRQVPEQLDVTEVFSVTVGRKEHLYVIASPCTSVSA
ncbi:hypothetical protein NL676_022913 [Syzygium grande]|nr:hypothetical protein NL676_022913 [Syzygium grande]